MNDELEGPVFHYQGKFNDTESLIIRLIEDGHKTIPMDEVTIPSFHLFRYENEMSFESWNEKHEFENIYNGCLDSPDEHWPELGEYWDMGEEEFNRYCEKEGLGVYHQTETPPTKEIAQEINERLNDEWEMLLE